MNTKDLIKPIEFIGVGQCYICCSPLVIYENELTTLFLDKNGLPINHEVEYTNTIGICPNCKKKYNINKQGMHYRIASGFNKPETECDAIEEVKDNPFKKE